MLALSFSNKKMLSLAFKFQLLIVCLAFTLASAVSAKPAVSNQTCQHGLVSQRGAKAVICNPDATRRFECPFNQCHITIKSRNYDLWNYHFTACKTNGKHPTTINALHPYVFTVANDNKGVVVLSGWYFVDNTHWQNVQANFTCPFEQHPLNEVRAHCGGCTVI
ncbi:hypothetical protein O181_051182 [Austropuccinia psidii MF-1]|uniref:Secreted protein n=1 Tax=Austropuccinia psidii MF-1 TaxID=1389203 RepID=A0A9Q3HPB2_9BASI|nr:hypothetical protein [Austropuccinia psidii MF-1]